MKKMYVYFRTVAICLILAFFTMSVVSPANAAVNVLNSSRGTVITGKKITLSQAKALALKNSSSYLALESKLALAKVRYTQSVKSLNEKRRDKRTFRWSPLLSLKFPEPNFLDDDVKYVYEPLEKQSEIDKIIHKMSNDKYGIYEKTSTSFVKCYSLQEQIAFEKSRLEALNATLVKNKARLVEGTATQADIDKIQASIDSTESKMISNESNLENEKEKLYKLIGLDIRSGYTFVNPFDEAEISREQLDSIIDYTLRYDESYYEAQVNTHNALLEMNANYNSMKNKYSSFMYIISPYVNQAKDHNKIDASAFKLSYEDFLVKIDAKWQGKYKVCWFIKIPKEWLKGTTDGIRYVEDEPYALYEGVLNYQDAYLEENQTREDIISQLKDTYNNYASVKKTYRIAAETVENTKTELEKSTALNLLGEMSFSELSDLQEEYESLQMDELTALADYTTTLINFDALSCGAVSKLLSGASIDMDSDSSGLSYVVEDIAEGAFYYIHTYAQDNAFELGVCVPEDFDVDVTDFELWINGMMVGERTKVGSTLKHLSLAIDNIESAKIRIYGDGEFVCDCDIDPELYSAPLNIVSDYHVDKPDDNKKSVASFSVDTNVVTGTLMIKVSPIEDEVKYFDIQTADGQYLGEKQCIDIKETFKYLGLVSKDMSSLKFNLYDEGKNLLYSCQADCESWKLLTDK